MTRSALAIRTTTTSLNAPSRSGAVGDRLTIFGEGTVSSLSPFVPASSLARSLSLDPGKPEALDEPPPKRQEGDQERAGGHERGGRDDRPVDALIGRGEDAEGDGERAGLDRYTPESGTESVGAGMGGFDPKRSSRDGAQHAR